MALSKTFEDMKQPEQVKLVKAIQKELGDILFYFKN